jgi:arylformamidase
MALIDVTVPVHPGMVIYEGDPEVQVEEVLSIAAGHPANVSRLELGSHTGTHIDAPAHFLPGAAAVDDLPLEAMVGPAHVVDATGAPGDIDRAALDTLDLPEADRLLFRTRNSELWARPRFTPDFVTIAPDAARDMVGHGVRLVGVDYLSVGSPETHRILLGAGVVVLEGLDLRRAPIGPCRLICLPLRLAGLDGAPARVLLET